MTYTPEPLDAESIGLPAHLQRLVDRLAANAHDTWARARIDQGWTWGAVRNHGLQLHPCLCPYEHLPEAEQELDRALVRGVVLGILLLGYRIDLPSASLAPQPGDLEPHAKRPGDRHVCCPACRKPLSD